MLLNRIIVSSLFLAFLTLNARAQQTVPAASVPPPAVGILEAHPGWPAARKADDVDTVNHLIASLYDVISGPAGKARDWDRFRSLFLPDGRLGAIRSETPASQTTLAHTTDAIFLTPDMYVERDDPYFKAHGFFERGIANRTEQFGNLLEVWSTYESRNAIDDSQPFSRGINSFQVMHLRGRYWIVSLFFDNERPGLTLPARYLTDANYDESMCEHPTTSSNVSTKLNRSSTPLWRLYGEVSESYGEESFKSHGGDDREARKTECSEAECNFTVEESGPKLW